VHGIALPALVVLGTAACSAPDYDVVITGGTVYDGSGGDPFVADVGIADGMIGAVGDLSAATAFETIDAAGLMVAPGFIDAHSHAEIGEPWGKDAVGFLTQGISTVVLGLDGGGAPEVDSVLSAWEELGIGVNALYFVGHNAVRRRVMGNEPRAPTDEELDSMKALVRKGMEEGAFGLSTGLFYTPGTFSETEEVIDLAKVAAEWDGAIYDTHDRDLGATYGGVGYDTSVAEAIRIAEESGLRGIFSHFNPQGATNYGRADVGERMIEEARARGVEMYAAHHPYTATQSNLRSYALPRWSSSGSTDEILARFEDQDTAELLQVQIMESLAMRGGPGKILIVEEDERLNGRTLAGLADEWGTSVPETVRRVIAEWGNASVMNLELYDIENTRHLARMPWMMTCTDGRTPAPGQNVGHPRASGAFPRKMRLFALEGDDISVPFAVRSFSGLAADFFGLDDRGYIEAGRRADVVVIDLDRYTDHATMDEPRILSEGVIHLLVNGRFAVRDEQPTGILAGKALRAPWEHADDE
jgi:N-acyl-D-amino-acid deacylase